MGICFVGKRKNFEGFIDQVSPHVHIVHQRISISFRNFDFFCDFQYIEPRCGKIVTLDGKYLGEHEGVHHFTLGKRIAIQGCHVGYFVARIDAESNTVYAVSSKLLILNSLKITNVRVFVVRTYACCGVFLQFMSIELSP